MAMAAGRAATPSAAESIYYALPGVLSSGIANQLEDPSNQVGAAADWVLSLRALPLASFMWTECCS